MFLSSVIIELDDDARFLRDQRVKPDKQWQLDVSKLSLTVNIQAPSQARQESAKVAMQMVQRTSMMVIDVKSRVFAFFP